MENKKRVIIFGASENTLERCASNIDMNTVEILCFVDNSQQKQGSYITSGIKGRVGGKRAYLAINKTKIISPEEIKQFEYDYIMISSYQYAESIYKQLTEDYHINKSKILLILDTDYNAIFRKIELFGNDSGNAHLFLNNKYSEIIKVNDILNTATCKEKGLLLFDELIISLHTFMLDERLNIFEFNDILQKYVLKEELFDYIEGPYETDEVFIEESDYIIDAGANIGLFSALAAVKAKKGRVYSFEPVPYVQSLLKETVQYYDNINIIPAALSDYTGKSIININKEEHTMSSLSRDNNNAEHNKEVVDVYTIDQFVKENKLDRVDFIKADIEGAERFMLKGAIETMKNFAPKIAICTYHLEDDKEVLEDIIKTANPNYVVEHKWLKLFAHVPE